MGVEPNCALRVPQQEQSEQRQQEQRDASGLPIGNLTSQFWANVYLNPFDHFIKRQLGVNGYLRFVDDFMLFGNSKESLWQCKNEIEARLNQFRLTIHPNSQVKPVSEGIPFLGFMIFPQKRRLKQRKGIHFQRKLKQRLVEYQAGEIELGDVTASVQGWVNHVRYANSVGLRKKVLYSARIPKRKQI